MTARCTTSAETAGKVGGRTTCQLGATSSIHPRPFLQRTVTCLSQIGGWLWRTQHYADDEDDDEGVPAGQKAGRR